MLAEDALVDAFAGLRGDLERGEQLDPALVESLLERVGREAQELPRDDVLMLQEHVRFLEEYVRDAHDEVGERLKKVGQGRWALRGYSFLRKSNTGQRLFRKA